MQNNSSPGQAVYDPFLGSGTTLIAAETVGRGCLAMELDTRYVDVAVRRWQAFTGVQATLLGDGRPFDVIAAERLKSKGAKSSNSISDPTTTAGQSP
jgi:DNA methylase